MPPDPRRGLILSLVAALGGSLFVVPWKMASEHGGVAVNTFVLLASAAFFNTLLGAWQQRALPRFSGFEVGFSVAIALLTLIGNLASAAAIEALSPAVLNVFQRSEVIVVALMAWPLLGERVDRRFWLGALVAVAGLALMQWPFDPVAATTRGLPWAALSTLCFSAMAVMTRRWVTRIDLVSVNTLRLWLSIAFWFGLHGAPAELFEINRSQVWYAGMAGFFGPFFARLCLMAAARHLEARMITLVTLVSPVSTLALAWLVLGDLPTPIETAGGLVMIVGIAIPILTWPGPPVRPE